MTVGRPEPGELVKTVVELVDAVNSGSGGGGLAAANPFTVETMPDPVSGDTMTVMVFPTDQTTIAWKLAGDAFPRMLWTSDTGNGLYLGDGTSDPYGSDGASIYPYRNLDGTTGITLGASVGNLKLGAHRNTVDDHINIFNEPVQIDTINGGPVFKGGFGPPTNLPGVIGDLYFRRDAGSIYDIFYRCTVTGVASAATWVPVLSPPDLSNINTTTISLTTSSGFAVTDYSGYTPITANGNGAQLALSAIGTGSMVYIAAPDGTIFLQGNLTHVGNEIGFYGAGPTPRQTGVPVTAAGIHAALVTLGLITA